MSIPSLSIAERVAIVTGSSQGIGNRLARGFAESGASVVLAARNASKLEATASEIAASGGKALAVPTDVTRPDQVDRMVETSVKEFGRIDVLVNCAGGTGPLRFIPLLEMDEEAWCKVVDLNLKSVYLCCRAAAKVMAEQRSGSIINFSSGAGIHPVKGMTHYGSAKAGVNRLTRILAAELGQYNVRVNAISPGLINTDSERQWVPTEMHEKIAKSISLGRVGQTDDLLGIALFLASDGSSYISGDIIPVSGGPQ